MYMLQEASRAAGELWQEATKTAESMWQQATKAVGLSTYSDESAASSQTLVLAPSVPQRPRASWAKVPTDVIKHIAGFLRVDDACRLQCVETRLRNILLDPIVPIHLLEDRYSYPRLSSRLINNLFENDANHARLKAIAARVTVLPLFYISREKRVPAFQFFPKAQDIRFIDYHVSELEEPIIAALPASVQTITIGEVWGIRVNHFLLNARLQQVRFRLGKHETKELLDPFFEDNPDPFKLQLTKTVAYKIVSLDLSGYYTAEETYKALHVLHTFSNLQNVVLDEFGIFRQMNLFIRKLLSETDGKKRVTLEKLAKTMTKIEANALEHVSEDDLERLLPYFPELEKLELPPHITGACFKALPRKLQELSSWDKRKSQITDANLAELKPLSSLRALYIISSQIHGTTLPELPLSLREIRIYSPQMTTHFGKIQEQAFRAKGVKHVDVGPVPDYLLPGYQEPVFLLDARDFPPLGEWIKNIAAHIAEHIPPSITRTFEPLSFLGPPLMFVPGLLYLLVAAVTVVAYNTLKNLRYVVSNNVLYYTQ